MASISVVCEWMRPEHIQPLLPGVSVQLVVDDLNHPPRRDVDLNIFLSVEPPVICPQIYSALANRDWCYNWDLILTPCIENVSLRRRAKKYNLNASFWVKAMVGEQEKKFGISTIMSNKRYVEGHQLRHWFREHWSVRIPSTIFHGPEPAASPDAIRQPYPEDRRDCFRYMFHLTIENCRSPGYFTEKLMDCFRTKCVPIYWGAPDIGDYFNVAGMIIVSHLSGDDILKVVSTLTPADYESRRLAMEENLKKAETLYGVMPACPENDSYERLAQLIREAQQQVLDSKA